MIEERTSFLSTMNDALKAINQCIDSSRDIEEANLLIHLRRTLQECKEMHVKREAKNAMQ